MKLLSSTCRIKNNIRLKDSSGNPYIGTQGTNDLRFLDDEGMVLGGHLANVTWGGKGSPYPTPPGGPWKTDHVTDGNKYEHMFNTVGECWYIHSNREEEVFFHRAKELSYGCLIANPNDDGKKFFALVKSSGEFETEQKEVIDERTDQEKLDFPIDYSKMTKKIT